jgi:hypothetical protein
MRKEIRAEINRANAQKSTGPKTIEGKQRSSMNACKHNLTGQSLILQEDETEAYNRLTTALLLDLKPGAELERQVVQKMIDAHFRLNRLAGVENNIFNFALIENTTETPHDDRIEVMVAQTRAWIEKSASFDVLGRYEARLVRQVLLYTLELERLQAARRIRENRQAHAPRHERKRLETEKFTFDMASFGRSLPGALTSANSFHILTQIPLGPALQPVPATLIPETRMDL